MRPVSRGICLAVLAALLMPVAAGAGRIPAPDNLLAESLDLPQQSEQPGVADLLWQAGYKHPGGQFHVLVHFPQGLSERVDMEVAAFAKAQFDETNAVFLSMAADMAAEAQSVLSAALLKKSVFPPEEEFRWSAPYFSVVNYQVHRSSARYASIHFMGSEYTGGAHGNRFHIVLSFDLTTGVRLAFDDLFADKDAGLPRLVSRIADGVQELKVAGTEPVLRDPASIDATMERIALTSEGLRVVYAPYEMGSYAEGEFIVDIPREELVKMGIRADFWKN